MRAALFRCTGALRTKAPTNTGRLHRTSIQRGVSTSEPVQAPVNAIAASPQRTALPAAGSNSTFSPISALPQLDGCCPPRDVYRLSAHSQLQRLLRNEARWDGAQLQNLRFDHGRYGEPALALIAQDSRAPVPEVQTALQQVQNAQRKQRLARSQQPPMSAVQGKLLKKRAQNAKGHTAPQQAWWEAVESGRLHRYALSCVKENLPEENACAVLQLPLKVGGPALPLRCQLHEFSPNCVVFGQDARGQWRYEGQLIWDAVKHALRPRLEASHSRG